MGANSLFHYIHYNGFWIGCNIILSQTYIVFLHKALFPVIKAGIGGYFVSVAVIITGPAFTYAIHVLEVRAGAAAAPGMEGRGSQADLVLGHFEYFTVQVAAQGTGVVVEGRNDLIALHAQGSKAVFLGNGRNGAVRGFPPNDHLGQLCVDRVDQALLVRPAAVPEGLVVRRPGSGEDLFNGSLVEGLHRAAHAQPFLHLKSGVVIALLVDLAGRLVHIVQLISIQDFRLLLKLQL